MRSLLLLSILSFLTACSQQGKTPTDFQVSFGAITGFTGPVIITGKSTTGHAFSRVLTGEALTLQLPNGTWNFLALSWSSAGAFQGTVRCGFRKGIALKGGSTAVSLVVTNAGCSSSALVDPGHYNGNNFRTNLTQLCRVPVAGLTDSDSCSFEPGVLESKAAPIASAKLGVREMTVAPTGQQSAGPGMFTGCSDINDMSVVDAARLPMIKPDFFWPVVARGYFLPGCSAGGGILDATPESGTFRSIASEDADIKMVFASFPDSKICQVVDAMGIDMLDQVGLGAATRPYGLCSLAQFHEWQRNYYAKSAYRTANVYLLRDLDLSPGLKFGALTPNAHHPCLPNGSTMIPIGHTVSAYPGCAWSSSVVTAFTGSFHGLGHKISNFRFQAPEDAVMDDVGLFGRTQNSSLSFLTLENVEVSGENGVAGLVGSPDNSYCNSIYVKKVRAEGAVYVGGIFGNGGTNSGLDGCHATKGEIRGSSYLGGLAGMASAISSSSFQGSVVQDYRGVGGTTHVGGLAGKAGSLHTVTTAGYVKGMNTVGGLAGEVTGAGPVVRFGRSTMAVISTFDAISTRVGGLAVYISNGSSSVEESLFAGSMSVQCTYGSGCKIGEAAGEVSAAAVKVVTVGNISGLGGTNGTTTLSGVMEGIYAVTAANLCSTVPCQTGSWSFVTGDLPRLPFESSHPCTQASNLAAVSSQMATRGTQSSPIAICTRTQLSDVGGAGNKYFKLLQDVPAIDYGLSIDLYGKLDGDDHYAYAGGNPGGSYTMFDEIVPGALVENLRLVGFSTGSPMDGETAALALTNNGTIKNVRALELRLMGSEKTAGLVVYNNGLIQRSSAQGTIEAPEKNGGITYSNSATGSILDSRADVRLVVPYTASTTSGSSIGGIAATNYGNIKRSEFRGNIDARGDDTNFEISSVGGITGQNSGVLEDVLVGDRARIETSMGDNPYVGGIAGQQASPGSINRAVMRGSVTSTGGTPNPAFTHAVGYSAGGTTLQNLFADLPALIYQENGGGITGSGTCSFTSAGLTDGSYYLQIDNGPEWLQGTISTLVMSFTEPSSGCGTNWSAYSVANGDAVDPIDLTQLGLAGFTITNMDSSPTSAALAAYVAYQAGATPTPPTVWMWEDGEPQLFRFDD